LNIKQVTLITAPGSIYLVEEDSYNNGKFSSARFASLMDIKHASNSPINT